MIFDANARAGHGRLLVDALLVLGLVVLLKATAALVMPIVGALLLALLLSTPTEALQRRGVPAALAAALAAFVPAVVAFGLVLAAWPSALAWWGDLHVAFGRIAAGLRPYAGQNGVAGSAARWLLTQEGGGTWTAQWGRDAGPWALGAASVLMLTFFLLWGQRSLVAALLRAAPDRRSRLRRLGALRDARRGAGTYLATMTWVNLGLALATGAGIALLGVANAPAWIGAMVLLLYVPYLGPAAIALLLATASPGATLPALAAPPLLFLGLHAIEAQFFSPWLMGRRLRVGRPALLLSVMAGGWAWGLVGGVLAVPLLIAGHALIARRRGGALGKALLAGEAPDAPSLADTAASALHQNRPRGRPRVDLPTRVRRMPTAAEASSECASPTSPRPIRPRSTASR